MTMRYKLLGRSGLRVSELALGTMTFGESWGWGASKDESRRIFEAFVEAGGNFVDTACNYTDGESESILGELVQDERERLVVATKYTLTARRDDPNAGGNHRKNLVHTLEGSLRRLRTDYVDLLWLHMWDGMTPVEEVVRALDDLVSAGKVLYVGFSDTPAWVVSQAVALAELRGWARPVAIQAPYSLADRDVERELLPMARSLDLTFTPWGTLEGGALTGKYLEESSEPRRYSGAGSKTNDIAREVIAVAEELGATPSQVAIAWVRAQPWHSIPIVGARSEVQLSDNLGALELELPKKAVERLSAASSFSVGFPREFLESDHVRGLIFGDTFDLIDDHRTPSPAQRETASVQS
jgi:aryl-alcohol dehydrogenase-like predicted oxidoreductase